jgi:site-specific recombinase XerD
MITIYYLCDKRKAYKGSKEVPLIANVKYAHDNKFKSFRFSTGLKVNPKYFRDQVLKVGEVNAEYKNEVLRKIKEVAAEIYGKGLIAGKLPSPEVFKEKILSGAQPTETEKTIIEHLDSYINYMTARQNAGRIKGKSVIYTLERLKGFLNELYEGKAFTFENIDKGFETKFLQLLTKKEFSPNTISSYTKRLKMFLNWATVNNLNKNNIYKSFEMPEEAREIIALSETEVAAIAGLQLEKHKHVPRGGTKLIRDWFIIATQTGLRYSDFHKIAEPELITVTGGYDLKVKTTKTGAQVVIPVSPILYRIFKEYDFQIPLPPSNQKFNRGLEKITGLAKLKKPLSSHVGRKTFCTIQYSKGVPIQFIMAISGHRTEKEFYRYIGVNGEENAQLMRGLNKDFVIEHEQTKLVVNR